MKKGSNTVNIKVKNQPAKKKVVDSVAESVTQTVPSLNIERPICFIDLETTGTNPQTDRIVEICVYKLFPDGTKEIKTHLVNCEIEIPKQASDIHGITNEMLLNKPTFKNMAKSLLLYISGCDFAGFSSNHFDMPMLYNEFHRAEVKWDYREAHFIDVCNIFKIEEPRTLAAAYKFYTGKVLEDAHSAEADILATGEILFKMLERYPKLPQNIPALALHSNYNRVILDINGKFTVDAEGDIIFNFGQYIGKKAKNMRPYLEWMLKSNFATDTKGFVNMALYHKKPVIGQPVEQPAVDPIPSPEKPTTNE
jgi:DNA polymerase-3 subunit epsilon